MAKLNLEEVASSTFDDVPDDTNCPNGVYLAQVTRSKLDSTEGGAEGPKAYIELILRPIEVVESAISTDDLANVYPIRDRLFLSPKARKRTKRVFANAMGLDVENVEMSTVIEMAIGQVVKVVVEQSVDENKKDEDGNPRVYTNISKYMAA